MPALCVATTAAAQTAGDGVAPPKAAGGDADLAMKLANPIASLISVPFQQNWDLGMGPTGDGVRYSIIAQPVVPISISNDWNMISRTIVPVIAQDSVTAQGESQFGLGDTLQSLFFSPKKVGKLIWGAGPVLALPTGTDRALGTGKWGIGPTAVALTQIGGLTVGMLVNHVWSVAGASDRPDTSATFMQPFLAYATKRATTFGINTETSYDWKRDSWTVPVNVLVSQLVKAGKQPLQIGLGGRYYLEKPVGGPDWGIRMNITLLFPA
jgi:hypothetical protein